MPEVDIVSAVVNAAAYWPWLALVVGAQVAHELTHFAVARLLGVKAWIELSLRSRMAVIYPEDWREWWWASHGREMPVDLTRTPTRPVTTRMDLAIGLAPTAAGLTGLTASLTVWGWPEVTPTVALAGFAWLLYTLPSSEDIDALGAVVTPEGDFKPFQRELLIGFGAIACGALFAWIIPYRHPLVYLTVEAFGAAGVAYLGVSLWEEQPPLFPTTASE